ncbi:hypothetical protein [Spirillospora sp. NPDC047279]|uniref:hypothetical protein n=1 Tax=Spirillospora sp. NPDC047279 TaxID=3155478 RepID=UPI0033C9B9BD
MAERESEGGVFIPTERIYDLLRESIDRTNERLTEIRSDIRSMSEQTSETTSQVKDHEDRIREVERWKNRMPATALTALLAAVASIVTGYLKITGK